MFCVIARGTQNKPIIRHHCIPPRMANMGNANSIQCWWSWSWTGICEHFVGIHVDHKLFGELWNTYSPNEMPVSFLHVYFRELKKKKSVSTKKTHVRIYITVLLSITPVWKWLGTPARRRPGEPSLMRSHRGHYPETKEAAGTQCIQFQTVSPSLRPQSLAQWLTVGGGGWEEVGWEGMRVYSYLGFPRLCLWCSFGRGPQFQADHLCLLPQKARCLSPSVNYCVSSRVLSQGSDSVRTHQSLTSLSLIPYKLTLDFKTFSSQI